MQRPRGGCTIMNQAVHYSLFQNQLVRYCQLLLPVAVKPRGGRSPFCFRLSHSLPSCLFTCRSRRKCFLGTWEVCFSTMGEHHGTSHGQDGAEFGLPAHHARVSFG